MSGMEPPPNNHGVLLLILVVIVACVALLFFVFMGDTENIRVEIPAPKPSATRAQ